MSSYKLLLSSHCYSLTKNKPRRKALNFKEQRASRDLFKEHFTEEKRQKRNKY